MRSVQIHSFLSDRLEVGLVLADAQIKAEEEVLSKYTQK